MMSRTLGLVLLALACTVGLSQANGFTENGLSLLSYELCSYPVTRSVQKLQAVQTSHVTYVSCGGWIPWRRCPKTVYRTQYLVVEVPESRNVTDCCVGYEQLGLYCVLPLNRSGEFASRPGGCPTTEPASPSSPCSLDTDCPGVQKCCPWSEGHHCVAAAPPGAEKGLGSWYNVTVLVKMGFDDLQREDPGLRNHTRLLYSLVTSALRHLDPAVHYLTSAGGGDTFTTASWLLLGLPQLWPVANVSAMLDNMVKRIYEVISIRVQDVNECLYEELHACPIGQQCVNVEGSYQCISSQELNHTGEDCPPVRDFVALNVTSSSFHLSWSLNSTQNHTLRIHVYRDGELLRSTWTGGRALAVAGLEPGVLYRVRTSYQGCGDNVSATLFVKTDAWVFGITIRITNRNLTDQLLNCSSEAFLNFSRELLHEVETAFPPAISDLSSRGKLRLQLVNLQAGSLVVTLRLTLQDPEFPVGVSMLKPILQLLSASTVFQVDQQGTTVQDWDECAHSSEHDCSPDARCINLEGFYTCQCLTTRDANPSRAGRVCKGDMVTPTGGGLSTATRVTAPAVSVGATALGSETFTLSSSPRNPQNTPKGAQAQTPGPPPRRGGISTVGQGRNGTGQGPTHGSWTTDGPLDTPGQLQGDSTTDPSFWPALTKGPTDHVVWHPSIPTQETPLNSTRLQNEGPPPSSFPGLPSVPTPVAPEPSACAAQKLTGKVQIANIQYSESFRNASSKEYQDFLELFSRMVRDSLPAMLRQHMDTGRIRVDVTGITNGSIVVEFDLLIIGDLDVREASAAFLAALQNTSVLEVVRGDTVLHDFDECGRKEDDCAPGMSCQNTFGSFTCICAGGAPESHVEYSGRLCEGGSPGNTVQMPGPGQPTLLTETWVAPVQGTSSVPQDLPLRLNLTDAVGVFCEIEKVVIAIEKRFLQQEAIPEASLYLGEPSCNVSDSNSTHVLLVANWGECGTLVQSNMTSTVVRTTLRNDLSPEGVIHYLQILSPIHCAFRNDLLTSSGYTPQWGVYTIIEDLHGAGNFVTEMQLFIGDSPIPQNYSVSASDEIKIEVELHRKKSSLKVVLTECWATPSSNAGDPVTFGFINNSCPVPNTYTSVIQNGDSSKAQFKLRIFSFINNSIVYLHCKLRVCMESPEASCKISCSDFRLLRNNEAMHQMTWGPLFRSEGAPAQTRPGLGTGPTLLIAAAGLTVVAGATVLLILRYQRTSRKYNLKLPSDNFGYQAFSQ
uniref:Uromodulin-like 1 n=1 Tax=Nannospalax galili TaxID=1026970 RepID=A0A8C6R9E2_NANGA